MLTDKKKKPAARKRKSTPAKRSVVESNVESTLERLRVEGFRITPQREDILRLLAAGRKRQTVQEIFQAIRKRHRSISLDTVYRTLGTFTNLGVFVQIKNGTDLAYEFQPPGHHHHHAVCLSCGTSVCLHDCPLPKSFFKDLEAEDFRVLSHAFEVYGYCASCRQA